MYICNEHFRLPVLLLHFGYYGTFFYRIYNVLWFVDFRNISFRLRGTTLAQQYFITSVLTKLF